ncbi:probable ATP-dependent RNA helicase ddx5 [Impatiens glandulifera]|uniref:probable ATP-dependent RNA helicase ddx5 n=1 Tax=Impatiens glandulifera TaxID=253017 RepID=UPI001FB0B8C5|nr:probable ATP-dependent RNA helicase ddx5 [Impatiens glandulifera]
MAKGDDYMIKKKNKKNRKKLRNDDSTASVSKRIASLIAAKKRRKSGKRSMCQGMCFSLPSPEDPFNEMHLNPDSKKKKIKKLKAGKSKTLKKRVKVKNGEADNTSITSEDSEQEHAVDNNCPSKFVSMCLNSIHDSLRHGTSLSIEEDKPLFVDIWGIEFWKCYSVGNDILETSGSSSSIEQIAWIASTAADSISGKEKEGFSLDNPYVLFLVPSQEKAVEVRSVCKPLKSHGIHTVSLHSGVTIDRQIEGLKSCEPEFLVSTPERLMELLSMKAIDISGVTLLVVDGLEALIANAQLDAIKFIKQSISANHQTLVFADGARYKSKAAMQSILHKHLLIRKNACDLLQRTKDSCNVLS